MATSSPEGHLSLEHPEDVEHDPKEEGNEAVGEELAVLGPLGNPPFLGKSR